MRRAAESFTEADPDNNIISDESPIGKALLGKKVGEIAEAELPTGGYHVLYHKTDGRDV